LIGAAPLAALFSASSIGRGKVVNVVGAVGLFELTVTLAGDGGSFELQLDTPNAASSPREMTVQATRSGVQNFIALTSFFSDI
jgi:hypothetical protein